MKFIFSKFILLPKNTFHFFPAVRLGKPWKRRTPFPHFIHVLINPSIIITLHKTTPIHFEQQLRLYISPPITQNQIGRRAAISTCIQLPQRKPVQFHPFNPNSSKSINPKIIPWINTIPPIYPKSGNFFRSRGKVSTFPLFISIMSTIYTPNISLTPTLGTYKLHPSLLITLQFIHK